MPTTWHLPPVKEILEFIVAVAIILFAALLARSR